METGQWVVLVLVLAVVAVIALMRSRRTQASKAQDHRMSVQQQAGAHSAAEEISQREDRRLGGMSAEDRDWEQASLQRNREREELAQSARDSAT